MMKPHDELLSSRNERVLGRSAIALGSAALGIVASSADAAVVNNNPADLATSFNGTSNASTNVYFDVDGGSSSNAAFAGADYFLNYTNDSAEKPELASLLSTNALGPVQLAKGGTSNDYTVKFGPGAVIDAAHSNWSGNGWLENGDNNDGLWTSSGVGFAGLRLDLGGTGGFNYGWARIDYNDDANTMTLLDFAYETTPDVGITTPIPEPHSLALAALGAAGIGALRRRHN
jgi:MYXO-CTERM domain-containing protein